MEGAYAIVPAPAPRVPQPVRGAGTTQMLALAAIFLHPQRLERWHERAILAASVAEVLDEPS